MSTKLTGNVYGQRQGSAEVVHTYVVNFNDTGIASGIQVDTIRASSDGPVIVEAFYDILTVFNAVTTNVLTAGTSSTATEWLSATSTNEALAGFYPSSMATAIAFAGHSGAGACTATGVLVGDRILSVTGVASGTVGDQSAKFESVVSVNDQIQQSSATDLSANIYTAMIQRGGTANRFRLTADTGIWVKYTQTGTAATTGQALLIVKEYKVNNRPITQT